MLLPPVCCWLVNLKLFMLKLKKKENKMNGIKVTSMKRSKSKSYIVKVKNLLPNIIFYIFGFVVDCWYVIIRGYFTFSCLSPILQCLFLILNNQLLFSEDNSKHIVSNQEQQSSSTTQILINHHHFCALVENISQYLGLFVFTQTHTQ